MGTESILTMIDVSPRFYLSKWVSLVLVIAEIKYTKNNLNLALRVLIEEMKDIAKGSFWERDGFVFYVEQLHSLENCASHRSGN